MTLIPTRKTDVRITDSEDNVIFEKKQFEVPVDWSDRAATIVASKYATDDENSVIDIINRVVDQITEWGHEQGYFGTDPLSVQVLSGEKYTKDGRSTTLSDEAHKFSKDLKDILVNQRAAFNSPVWFNIGIETNPNQASACFILPVEDTMDSILNHTVVEGNIFKGGSGAGMNVSKLRAKGEKLSNKGEASGPVSFMRGWDSFAGIIKSGGKVRRAAKLVCMDVDHPDIMEFIECKYYEEKKAKALVAAGISPEEAYSTVAFQNTNHSIRVTDKFMKLTKADNFTWELINRGNRKQPIFTTAADILHRTAEIAWETGDPGIQFDDRMNKDNPVPSLGRIESTNPCSEFSAINLSACNLASLNLTKYLTTETGSMPFNNIDWELFNSDIKILITAMDILIEAADYPTEGIRETTIRTRPLGLGFTNLGALLMLMGLPYNSKEGRELAGQISQEMTRYAYQQSIQLAKKLGSFADFNNNKETNLRIIEKLTKNSAPVSECDQDGLRNSQLTLLAPCGTISFMMDADTTGIEPLFALKSTKTLAGGGTMEIAAECIKKAIEQFGGYISDDTIKETIDSLSIEQRDVFRTANEIHWKDHILMMAACQQHLNGAISKTINMPNDCTVEDIEQAYMFAWENGIKALAVYRDGSKQFQPLVAQTDEEDLDNAEDNTEDKWTAYRKKLPETRQSITHKFDIQGLKGYITCGMYESGELGEIFVRTQKQGTTIQGLMDGFATSISLGLQYGVPLETLAEKFIGSKFEPAGFTKNEDIRIAHSIIDYIFRWIRLQFIDSDEDDEILTTKSEAVDTETNEIPMNFDGPPCSKCQTITSRVGTCFLCPSCGTQDGCG